MFTYTFTTIPYRTKRLKHIHQNGMRSFVGNAFFSLRSTYQIVSTHFMCRCKKCVLLPQFWLTWYFETPLCYIFIRSLYRLWKPKIFQETHFCCTDSFSGHKNVIGKLNKPKKKLTLAARVSLSPDSPTQMFRHNLRICKSRITFLLGSFLIFCSPALAGAGLAAGYSKKKGKYWQFCIS